MASNSSNNKKRQHLPPTIRDAGEDDDPLPARKTARHDGGKVAMTFLAEQILPLVFSSGALYVFDCGKTVPLVCKSWCESFRRCVPHTFPKWSLVEVVSFSDLPPIARDMARFEGRDFSWAKTREFQALITSHRFLRHVFDQLEIIRISLVVDQLKQKRVTRSVSKSLSLEKEAKSWGVDVQLAVVHICYDHDATDECAIYIRFMPQLGFRQDCHEIPDFPISGGCFHDMKCNHYWRCALSKNFKLLEYKFYTGTECKGDFRANEMSQVENLPLLWGGEDTQKDNE